MPDPTSVDQATVMGVCARCDQPAVLMVTDAPDNGRCAVHAKAIFPDPTSADKVICELCGGEPESPGHRMNHLLRHDNTRLRAALQAIAIQECATPDIHFIRAVDIARRALEAC